MSRDHVKLTEELELIACSCGRCCNVKKFEQLQAENDKLRRENEDLRDD